MSSDQVNCRVPTAALDEMDVLISEKKFRSRSDFLLYAIRFYLDYEKRTRNMTVVSVEKELPGLRDR